MQSGQYYGQHHHSQQPYGFAPPPPQAAAQQQQAFPQQQQQHSPYNSMPAYAAQPQHSMQGYSDMYQQQPYAQPHQPEPLAPARGEFRGCLASEMRKPRAAVPARSSALTNAACTHREHRRTKQIDREPPPRQLRPHRSARTVVGQWRLAIGERPWSHHRHRPAASLGALPAARGCTTHRQGELDDESLHDAQELERTHSPGTAGTFAPASRYRPPQMPDPAAYQSLLTF